MPGHNLITASLLEGLQAARIRPGLAVLLFLVGLAFAATASIPPYVVLDSATATTGFGPDLIQRFEPILMADIFEEVGDGIVGAGVLLLWLVPVVFLWEVASAVGLINALRSGRVRSFWEGVGRFTGYGLVLALLNLLLVGLWIGVTAFIVARVVGLMPPGSGPALPAAVAVLLLVSGAAFLGLLQDFARISLVCDGRRVLSAWIDGVCYPFRHRETLALYAAWWITAGLISLLLVAMHVSWGSTMEEILLLFLGQQALFFIRAAMTVAWFGSAVSLHERIRFQETPLLAGEGATSEIRPGDVPFEA